MTAAILDPSYNLLTSPPRFEFLAWAVCCVEERHQASGGVCVMVCSCGAACAALLCCQWRLHYGVLSPGYIPELCSDATCCM